jgi:hypothetical protein
MSSHTWFLLMAVSTLVLLVSTNGISVAHGSSSASLLYKCSYIGGAAIASDRNTSGTTTTTTSPYEIYLSSTNPAIDIKIRQVNDDEGSGNFTYSMAAANEEEEQQQQQATKQERLEISVKLVNSKTNDTIKDVIYFVNSNNASLETEQIGAQGKESNVYWDYSRSDKLGTMWLDVWSSGSAKYTTTTTTRLMPEPSSHHNSYLSRDEHARIHVITFESLKSDGKYHVEVEIVGINHCFNSDDDNSLRIKRDWTAVIEITSDDLSFCHGDRRCWHE